MIEVINLVKAFGDIVAVNNISFEVRPGDVLGFLGPNGAGKSTTMKILTGFIPPTSGTARVGGMDIREESLGVRRMIGYLPESAPSYSEMNVSEFLEFIAEVRGYRGSERDRRVDRIVEMTSLEEVRHQIIDTLSKGYRQRVCFAQALIHDPPVLILDEPTDGLDPNQKHEVRNLIRRMSEDKTIILSTHILEEMEAVCNRAIIISRGKIVVNGTPAELAAMSRFHNAVVVRSPQADGLAEKMKGIPGVANVEPATDPKSGLAQLAVFPEEGRVILPEITRFLDEQKIPVDEVFTERGKVDEVFRRLTE